MKERGRENCSIVSTQYNVPSLHEQQKNEVKWMSRNRSWTSDFMVTAFSIFTLSVNYSCKFLRVNWLLILYFSFPRVCPFVEGMTPFFCVMGTDFSLKFTSTPDRNWLTNRHYVIPCISCSRIFHMKCFAPALSATPHTSFSPAVILWICSLNHDHNSWRDSQSLYFPIESRHETTDSGIMLILI